MSVIKWEDPPTSQQTRASQYAHLADELRTRPKAWALVLSGSYHECVYLAGLIRAGSGAGPFAPKGSFEASQRRTRETPSSSPVDSVYARYVGEES